MENIYYTILTTLISKLMVWLT